LAKTFSQFPMDFDKSRKFFGSDLKFEKAKNPNRRKGALCKILW